MRVSGRHLPVVAAIILLHCLSVVQAGQVALQYDATARTFKACALAIQQSDGTWVNSHPLVFEGLRRCPLKPAGWDFENPLAPPQVVRGQATVTKSDASYWWVELDNVTASQLVGMDIIYISAPQIRISNANQRDALMKAARQGAVIWVDQSDAGGAGTEVSSFIVPFNFDTTSPSASNRRTALDYNNWLLRYPFEITSEDVRYIGHHPEPDAPGAGPSCDSIEGGFQCQPILRSSDGSSSYRNVTYTPYGAGAIVITAGELGWDLESWWQISGLWWSADQLRRPSRYQAPSFKFAYNIVAAASGWSQSRRSPSADGRSLAEVRPPLQIDWQFPGQFDPLTATKIGPVVSSPVYGGGMVFVATLGSPSIGSEGAVNGKLLCFDADPAQDLTENGIADDWIPDAWIDDPDAALFNHYRDYSLGKPYDMVWSADFGRFTPRDTSPVIASPATLPGARALQVVLVSLVDPSSGAAQVRCYNATAAQTALAWAASEGYAASYEETGALMWAYDIPAYSSSARVVALSTPVVHNDYVFVLASEFDSSLDGSSVNSTYGRAHAFKLSYEWDVNHNGPRWEYPDPNPSPAADGQSVGDPGLQAFPESQGALPPFHEPQWVAGLAPYNTPGPRPTLPPVPGAIPVPHSGQDVIAGSEWDVHLNVATPVGTNFTWNAGASRWDGAITGWSELLQRNGGWDIQLIPTPAIPSTGAHNPPEDQSGLNRSYYTNLRFLLPNGSADATSGLTDPDYTRVLEIRREDAEDVTLNPDDVEVRNVGSNVYIYLRSSGQARQLLLPARRDGRDPQSLALSGARIVVVYDADPDGPGGALPTQTYTQYVGTLRGPMRYRQIEGANRRRVTPPAISGPDSMIVVSDAAEDADRILSGINGGAIRSRDRMTGAQQWDFHTRTTLPNDGSFYGPYSYAALGKSAPAVDTDTNTAYVAMNHAQLDPSNDTALEGIASILGVATEADLGISLRPIVGSAVQPDAHLVPGSVLIETLDANYTDIVVLPSSSYEVDYENARITVNRATAGWLSSAFGALYGKPVWVSYDVYDPAHPTEPDRAVTIDGEMHLLPDVLRFQYMPGFIRLQNRFIYHNSGNLADPRNVHISLPNGIPVEGLAPAEREFTDATFLPPGFPGALPRGILDVRALAVPSDDGTTSMPLQPGSEVVVRYHYFNQTFGGIQEAAELHQIPYNIGESISSPALGGAVMHVGTEGFDPYRDNTLDYSEVHNDSHPRKPFLTGDRIRRTLLSLLWDPISGVLSGSMSQPALPNVSYAAMGSPVIPAVSSSPVIGRDRVFIGSKMVAGITQAATGYESEGVGFVSSLKSESTYICDDTRILQVVGQRPVWVAHGTLSPTSHERADIYRRKDERTAIPFNRPGKVLPLSNGNLLVVDTGNNRVVEIDRDGVVKWPLVNLDLDRDGRADPDHQYDYYTVPDEELLAAGSTTDLRLDSPSDVFRYYTVEDQDRDYVYNSVNGDLLPGTVAHTVIADSGNGRVIDVITRVQQDGNGVRFQTHEVHVKTPSHVKPSGSTTPLQRIAYTTARPIFDPSQTSNDDGVIYPVIGYLCAASDLHQLVVVEEGSKAINPFSTSTPRGGTAGTDWKWLAWLWDEDVDDGGVAAPNPLIFRNIRDVQTSYEGGDFYLTVTCGQFAGRMSQVQANEPSPLAARGDGVFEFVVDIGGAPGSWRLVSATDDGGNALADTPVWYMTREDFLYSYPGTGQRRDLTNIRYVDVGGNSYWQTMPWFPVAARRLPTDNRPMDANGDGNIERYHRHLIVNHAGMTANMTRATVDDITPPAVLGPSVMVVQTNDADDNYPGNDTLDIDVRHVIPNPYDFDWPDPLAQPTSAAQ